MRAWRIRASLRQKQTEVDRKLCCGVAAKVVLLLRKGQFTRSVSVNAAMTLVILFSLKTMESLENGLQTHSGATPYFSMRTESQASSQR